MPKPEQPQPKPEQPKREPSKGVDAEEKDRTFGGADKQRRFDEPKRSGTLTGMPAARVPGPPPLPLEHAPTRRAPSPWGATVMRPAPPSTTGKARRSDAPPASASTDPADASSGQPDASTELRRQLAEAQAQIDRLRQPAFPPPVSERPRLPAPPAAPAPGSVAPTGWSDPRLIKAVIALLAALTPLATAMGIYLTTKASAAERAAERQAEVAKDATQTASSAKAESRDVAKELDTLKQELAARRAYDRAVWRKLGVEYPAGKNEPAEPTIETQTPQRKPGVTRAPVLVVTTPPP